MPTRGTWIFEYVLQGHAIQDVFIFEDPHSSPKHHAFSEYGTTLRFPVGDGRTWKVVWVGPVNNVVRTFEAHAVGDDITLEGHNESGNPIRWVFSAITETSFHWRGEYSPDNGETWILYEELDARRK